MKIKIILIAVLISFTACAKTPQKVVVEPTTAQVEPESKTPQTTVVNG